MSARPTPAMLLNSLSSFNNKKSADLFPSLTTNFTHFNHYNTLTQHAQNQPQSNGFIPLSKSFDFDYMNGLSSRFGGIGVGSGVGVGSLITSSINNELNNKWHSVLFVPSLYPNLYEPASNSSSNTYNNNKFCTSSNDINDQTNSINSCQMHNLIIINKLINFYNNNSNNNCETFTKNSLLMSNNSTNAISSSPSSTKPSQEESSKQEVKRVCEANSQELMEICDDDIGDKTNFNSHGNQQETNMSSFCMSNFDEEALNKKVNDLIDYSTVSLGVDSALASKTSNEDIYIQVDSVTFNSNNNIGENNLQNSLDNNECNNFKCGELKELKDITNSASINGDHSSSTGIMPKITSPKPKFIAPRFEKKWMLENNPSVVSQKNGPSSPSSSSTANGKQANKSKSSLLSTNEKKFSNGKNENHNANANHLTSTSPIKSTNVVSYSHVLLNTNSSQSIKVAKKPSDQLHDTLPNKLANSQSVGVFSMKKNYINENSKIAKQMSVQSPQVGSKNQHSSEYRNNASSSNIYNSYNKQRANKQQAYNLTKFSSNKKANSNNKYYCKCSTTNCSACSFNSTGSSSSSLSSSPPINTKNNHVNYFNQANDNQQTNSVSSSSNHGYQHYSNQSSASGFYTNNNQNHNHNHHHHHSHHHHHHSHNNNSNNSSSSSYHPYNNASNAAKYQQTSVNTPRSRA